MMFIKILYLQILLFSVRIIKGSFALENFIKTNSGLIEGTVLRYNEISVQAFLGVPYAKPPVGDLRFRKTETVTPWSGCLQATHKRPACLQHHPPDYPWFDVSPLQSEDCLYLNIYVPPNTYNYSKKAVMFWIFSGGFSYGSANLPVYDGRVFVSEGEVILVIPNYRLGILGFLSAEEAPGNMGLHDMLEALKWVSNNIAAFGGDPENITLFGHSAGGISSGLMCVSPKATGLFKRIIMQSGSAAYSLNENRKINYEFAQKVAKGLGCPSVSFVQCLKSKPAKLLVEEAYAVHKTVDFTFSTIIGDDILPIDPQLALKSGQFQDVDVMMGFVQDEIPLILTEVGKERFGLFGEKDPCPKINKTSGENYMRQILNRLPPKESIVQYYLGNVSEYDYETVREQTYHSFGDFLLICPSMYFAESYAKEGKSVYAYYFNHIPSVNPWARWMGCVHFDEVAFVFGRPLKCPCLYTKKERYLSRTLITAWTNFAKYGSPGRHWNKYSRSNPNFKEFNISKRKSYLESHKKNCEFFRSIIGFP